MSLLRLCHLVWWTQSPSHHTVEAESRSTRISGRGAPAPSGFGFHPVVGGSRPTASSWHATAPIAQRGLGELGCEPSPTEPGCQLRRYNSTANTRLESVAPDGRSSLVKMLDTYFSAARNEITSLSAIP